jgi:glycosyltransferase involved in cell wall biosynthesis
MGWPLVGGMDCDQRINQKKEDAILKVVLIYRKPRVGAYSIEELFHTISGELGKHVEVIEYVVGSRSRILFDAWRLRQLGADIYHITGDINYFTILLPRKKTVLTVLDIGHYLYGLSGIKRWLYKWLWLIWPIQLAKMVTTISEETRMNIAKYLGVTNKNVNVIECCHSTIFKPMTKPFKVEYPIILQVGTGWHKNLPRIIEALIGVPCCLVIIGRLNNDLIAKLTEFGIKYECYANLSSDEMLKQYELADMVCFASLHEGFGLPIIEAQVVGRPVITSNILPMCEVAGDSACLVDPQDIESIRKGIVAVMSDPDYRTGLVNKGYINASRFSPALIASKYLQCYMDAIPEFTDEAKHP